MSVTTDKPSDRVPAENAAVSAWLRDLGFGEYTEMFAENGITAAALPALTDADLKEMGVHVLGHRRVMLRKIGEMAGRTMHIPLNAPKKAADLPGISKPDFVKAASPPKPTPNAMPAALAAGTKPAPTATPAPTAAPTSVPAVAAKKERPGGSAEAVPPPKVKQKRRWGGGFLFISIALHLLFGVFAYVYIVHVFTPKKLVFKGGPPSPNPAQKEMEHKVQMRKQRKAMTAPAPPKRVATTAQTKITLPEMPEMPPMTTAPAMMTGMGGVGTQFGAQGLMGNGGDGGGGGATMFGFRSGRNDGIIGTFYDLKQTRDRQPIQGMAVAKFRDIVNQFVTEGWNPDVLDQYYKSPNRVRLDQLLIPQLSDLLGPACFGEDKNCQPLCWVVHYKGNVIAPESFRFRFVGGGDDWVIVRFNDQIILGGGWPYKSDNGDGPLTTIIRQEGYYNLAGYEVIPRGYARSFPIDVIKGQIYSVEILFGEAHPVNMSATLLIEVEGTTYKKDANGSPILPLFRTTSDPLPPPPAGTQYPPHDDNAPVWKPAPPTMRGF